MRFCAFALLWMVAAEVATEGKVVTVTTGGDTTVTISVTQPLTGCRVCFAGVAPTPASQCSSSVTLTPSSNVTLLLNCSDPQGEVSVEILRTVECSQIPCDLTPDVLLASSFKDLNRTFTWHMTGLTKDPLRLLFPAVGARNVDGSETCLDGYRYSVSTNMYCRNGPLSYLDVPNPANMSLQVVAGEEVEPAMFRIETKPMSRMSRSVVIAPQPGTTIYLRKRDATSSCSVCTSPGSCVSQPAKITVNTSLEFTCGQPELVYGVEINRDFVCGASCQDIAPSDDTTLFTFNRTFNWDVRASSKAFQLDFSDSGVHQILPSEACPDNHTYTLVSYPRVGRAIIGVFCRGGPIQTVQISYRGRVSLDIPGQTTVDVSVLKVSVQPEIKTLALVMAELPPGATDFFSPNYPQTFPDDSIIKWTFTIPPKHNFAIQFLNVKEPDCKSKKAVLEYQWENATSTVEMSLTEAQPAKRLGSFSMSLRNCEMASTLSVLFLSFRVNVTSMNQPVVCPVNLQSEQDLVLQMKKKGTKSYCEMKMNSQVQEMITLSSGLKSNISFQDCSSDVLLLTAIKNIDCSQPGTCLKTLNPITVPALGNCFPVPLSSATWNLQMQWDHALQLFAPNGGLRQMLPGMECDGGFSLALAQDDGVPFGSFCPQGPIQKIQIKTNASVIATPVKNGDLSQTQGPLFSVGFGDQLSDDYIFTVSPTPGATTLLATPYWPSGMQPSTTASWVVTLPHQHKANLALMNVSQPVCGDTHTEISVQEIGSSKNGVSRRGDEKPLPPMTLGGSFYVNISNCYSEVGDFKALANVTLQKTGVDMAMIIGIVVGLLLLLMIVTVAVICAKRKKKTKSIGNRVSIYNPNGTVFRPGHTPFPKTREHNESHVYASIEDTAMYSNILPGENPQVDVYRPFVGPPEPVVRDRTPEPPPEVDARLPTIPLFGRQDSLAYGDPRIMGSELNTFKSNGDFVPLYLLSNDSAPEAVEEIEPEYDSEFDEQ